MPLEKDQETEQMIDRIKTSCDELFKMQPTGFVLIAVCKGGAAFTSSCSPDTMGDALALIGTTQVSVTTMSLALHIATESRNIPVVQDGTETKKFTDN